jgi:hypothetical protein
MRLQKPAFCCVMPVKFDSRGEMSEMRGNPERPTRTLHIDSYRNTSRCIDSSRSGARAGPGTTGNHAVSVAEGLGTPSA